MRERVNKEIDGIDYGLIPVSPFKSAKILTRLIKKGAKPVMAMFLEIKTDDDETDPDQKKKSILDMDVDKLFPQLVAMIEPLIDNLDEDDIERIVMELLQPEHFFAGGKKPTTDLQVKNYFNDHGVLHLLKVLRFSLEVNFSDFLGGLPDIQELLEKSKA